MRYYLMAALGLVALIGGWGCRPTPGVDETAVLITVGQREIRPDEFRRAYRLFKAAYGAEADETAAENDAILRFIQQLTDELILMEYAHDIGTLISDEELNQAVEEIRGDYPEGLFDQMLLETAVNFEDWKEALRVRLTIDRLVQQELSANVNISEEDIAAFYTTRASEQPSSLSEAEGAPDEQMDQLIIQQLRLRKTEEAYGPWLEDIRARYTITIDEEAIQRVLAESGIPQKSDAP
jgi:parvulin-like peptidyl-prolyl isomerase